MDILLLPNGWSDKSISIVSILALIFIGFAGEFRRCIEYIGKVSKAGGAFQAVLSCGATWIRRLIRTVAEPFPINRCLLADNTVDNRALLPSRLFSPFLVLPSRRLAASIAPSPPSEAVIENWIRSCAENTQERKKRKPAPIQRSGRYLAKALFACCLLPDQLRSQ